MKIFVYGNMMKGLCNHTSFAFHESARFIGPAILKGAALYDMGRYPFIMITGDENDSVKGELYEYTDMACHYRIRLMEFGGGFDEVLLNLDGEEAYAYIYLECPAHARRIPGGDWREYSSAGVVIT